MELITTEALPTPTRQPIDDIHVRARRLMYTKITDIQRATVLDELQGQARKASKREIAEYLAVLLKAFPNAGTADREAFVRILAEDVGASRPSIGVLALATLNLRRTCRFMPTIAEAFGALVAAESQRLALICSFGGRCVGECDAREMLPEQNQIDGRL